MYIEIPANEGLKDKLKEIATAHRRSLNQEVVEILIQAVNSLSTLKGQKKSPRLNKLTQAFK